MSKDRDGYKEVINRYTPEEICKMVDEITENMRRFEKKYGFTEYDVIVAAERLTRMGVLKEEEHEDDEYYSYFVVGGRTDE